MTTAELLALLKRHYIKPGAPLPGGVFLPEVGWNGGGASRCDAIYVGFTSTSGRLLVGHELKISRADWLNELNKPGKADAWADQCHQWWLVVSDPAIVAEGELPHGWGLMSPGKSKTRMTVHTKAETRAASTPSWNAVRSVIARQDTLRAQAIAEGTRDAHENARRAAERTVEERLARRHGPDTEELQRRMAAVEEALGGPIDWSDGDRVSYGCVDLGLVAELGAAARALGGVHNAVEAITGRYGSPVEHARRQLNRLDEALAGLRAAAKAKEVIV